ncbi:MAG: DUF1565 domain-containing protein [Candidatus Cloacimonetes bacterium]|nr:DUF1565 domain-containing protein [Candidatus Cloacimonadota bacterium]
MKKQIMFLLFMVLAIGALATTIYIPEDYTTIQEGIDVSEDGDEIIVSPGTYVENINFAGKAVTVGSLFYTTQDTSYISQTIIDGNQDGSVVTFENGESSTSVLIGFTVTNGYAYTGGGIYCDYASPNLENIKITNNSAESKGGGISCWSSNPDLENMVISGNSAENYGGGFYCDYYSTSVLDNVIIRDNSAGEYGGGIYCCYYSSPVLNDLIVTDNSAGDSGGGIFCQSYCSPSLSNIVLRDNSANYGGGFSCLYSSPGLDNLKITGNSANENGGGIWCSMSELSLEKVTITDNSAYNGGGIYYAGYSSLVFSSENRCNIYLNNTNNRGNGCDIYSTTNINVIVDTFTVSSPTGFHTTPIENFTFDILHGLQEQVNADLYVSLEGDNNNTGLTIDEPLKTIQHACSVILADSLNLHTIHLTEGIYSPSTNGEFFPIDIPDFVSLCGLSETGVILNAEGVAGVIRLRNVEYASISNLTITNGYDSYGGGISSSWSYLELENVTITNNSAEYFGGGIYSFVSSLIFSSENRCNIYLNNTNNRGNGSDIFSNTHIDMDVIVDTFTVLNPTDFHAAQIENFTFDILHGLQEQINADLYVSPEGDNSNSGLTIDEPLKTIQHACSVILADSQNLHTIHLAVGSYSPSTNGEFFPVDIPESVTLNGVSETLVILNAEGTAGVIRLRDVENAVISNLTITNGNTSRGGGIYFENSSPSIENVTITDNSAGSGGGISCLFSSPSLENVTIMHNSAESNGGGIDCRYSDPILESVTLTNNSAEYGGGIRCNNSNPSLVNVTIMDNSADNGGGISCNDSSPSLEGVTITNNWASRGGGIYCHSSSPSLENVTIKDNSVYYGGGFYCWSSSPILVNVTIANNSAGWHGGGIYCIDSSSPSSVNCIFWNNSPQEISFSGSANPDTITIAYSDIDGGFDGIENNNNGSINWLEGNMDADPIFEDAANGNYHLTEDSPCIDTGTSYFEYEGEVLVDLSEDDYFGIAPDMGAYEYGLVSIDELKIENVKLKINAYPNPFNPETTISFFTTEGTENTEISIYNLKGQKVVTLVNEPFEAGSHKVTWNAFGQSSGIYLLRFVTDRKSETKKLILLK